MPKARVLVIDDDPLVTQLLKEHLSTEGYEVAVTHMAEEGLQMATEMLPDLIFLDVMLPDATGFQTLGHLRDEPSTHNIPVIMMSGTARHGNQQIIGKNMGATDYVVKPFDVIKVGEKVDELLKDKIPNTPASGPITRIVAPMNSNTPLAEELAPAEEFLPAEEALPAEEPEETHDQETHIPFTPKVEAPTIPAPMHNDPREMKPAAYKAPEIEMPPSTKYLPEPVPEPMSKPMAEPMPEPTPMSVPKKAVVKPQFRFMPAITPWKWISACFVLHLILSIMDSKADWVRVATFTAGGWALLLGLIVATCAVLRLTLEAEGAIRLLGWSAIPIVLRSFLILLSGWIPQLASFRSVADTAKLPASTFWLRPLDIFEAAAILMLGLSLRRLPGSSIRKTILAMILTALGWCLTARGYFHPF